MGNDHTYRVGFTRTQQEVFKELTVRYDIEIKVVECGDLHIGAHVGVQVGHGIDTEACGLRVSARSDPLRSLCSASHCELGARRCSLYRGSRTKRMNF